jgi:hypothetical protein
MADGYVHTVHKDGQWTNTIEGEDAGGSQSYSTKEEAQAAGRNLARQGQTEHVIHNEDGSIAERNSYGNDPESSAG